MIIDKHLFLIWFLLFGAPFSLRAIPIKSGWDKSKDNSQNLSAAGRVVIERDRTEETENASPLMERADTSSIEERKSSKQHTLPGKLVILF